MAFVFLQTNLNCVKCIWVIRIELKIILTRDYLDRYCYCCASGLAKLGHHIDYKQGVTYRVPSFTVILQNERTTRRVSVGQVNST